MMLFPQVKVNIRQWLTRRDDNPVPMRTMVGYIKNQTNKSVYVVLHGKPEPSDTCLHCGRTLTHKVSLYYGIGPVCGKHFHIPNVSMATVNEKYEAIREALAAVKWEGWLPKSQLQIEETGEYEQVETAKWDIKFLYQGKPYHVVTDNPTKKEEIVAKAEKYQITPVA